MTDHISDLRWDRWLAGELSAEDTESSLAHAGGCDRCGARMRELSVGRDAFRDRPIPMTFAKARRRSRAARWIGGAATLVAAAAVLVLVVRPDASVPGERAKGAGPKLVVTGGRDGRLVALSSGDVVRPNDSIQVAYSAERAGFGAVIARDGANQVMAYVPSQGTALVALPAGVDRTFPESTVLDAVVGTETLHVVWCATARPLAPLLAEVQAGDLAPRNECYVRKLVLDKRAP